MKRGLSDGARGQSRRVLTRLSSTTGVLVAGSLS